MNKQPQPNKPEENPHKRLQVVSNRRARHEYFIDETFDAGLQLVGTEVKSVRGSKVQIQDAFCRVENKEVWVYGMHIAPFEHGTYYNVEPTRKRKLLLHKREIEYITRHMDQKGLTLIPLSMYFQHGYAKLEIGLARGKKLWDKRDTLADRDSKRQMERALAGKE